MPAYQRGPRDACSNATGFSSSSTANRWTGPEPNSRKSEVEIEGRFWLHLARAGGSSRPDTLIGRLTRGPRCGARRVSRWQSLGDAEKLTGGACAAEDTVRRTPTQAATVFADRLASGPAMFDTARLDRAAYRPYRPEFDCKSLAGGRPLPGYGPPASTKCCASPDSDGDLA